MNLKKVFAVLVLALLLVTTGEVHPHTEVAAASISQSYVAASNVTVGTHRVSSTLSMASESQARVTSA